MTVLDTVLKDRAESSTLGRLRKPAALIAAYGAALYIANIFLTYLPFKFIAKNPLFQKLENSLGLDWIEPNFRFLTGSLEGLAVVLLFIPGLQIAGAGLAFAIMSGAIATHLFTGVGIDPFNDGGTLFREAVTVWILAAGILALRRHQILPFAKGLLREPIIANSPRRP